MPASSSSNTSMTTERKPGSRSILRKIGLGLAWLSGLLFAWFGAMAAIMLLAEPAPAALVFARDIRALDPLSDDIRFIRGGNSVLVLTSDRPGYVGDLYRAGAWLVLPALRNGCLDPNVVMGKRWQS